MSPRRKRKRSRWRPGRVRTGDVSEDGGNEGGDEEDVVVVVDDDNSITPATLPRSVARAIKRANVGGNGEEEEETVTCGA